MKKLFALLLATACVTVYAQNSAKTSKKKFPKVNTAGKSTSVLPPSNLYTFSTFTAPYQNITGTVVSGGQKWDDTDYNIPIGFNFNLYNGAATNTITFFAGALITPNDVNNDVFITAACPMFEDLCDRAYDPNVDSEGDPGGISDISYTTTGTAPNRICKIEVNNAGFYGENDQNSVSVSYVNYQIWLYETTNDIEFRYGNCGIQNEAINLVNGTSGFRCLLFDSLEVVNTLTCSASNSLDGPYNSPSVLAQNPNFTDAVSGNIDNGRVYRFAKNNLPTVINKSYISDRASSVSVYPNPANELLNVRCPGNSTLEMYDVSGKQVLNEVVNGPVKLSELSPGFYIVKVKSETSEEIYNGKIIVSH
ncbi:MAG: C-terminal target protein [Bacteroidetes bacterium]|jgi:hypothetical protein|nr:C-terminal target protein [Bacteroidota bacterium]